MTMPSQFPRIFVVVASKRDGLRPFPHGSGRVLSRSESIKGKMNRESRALTDY